MTPKEADIRAETYRQLFGDTYNSFFDCYDDPIVKKFSDQNGNTYVVTRDDREYRCPHTCAGLPHPYYCWYGEYDENTGYYAIGLHQYGFKSASGAVAGMKQYMKKLGSYRLKEKDTMFKNSFNARQKDEGNSK